MCFLCQIPEQAINAYLSNGAMGLVALTFLLLYIWERKTNREDRARDAKINQDMQGALDAQTERQLLKDLENLQGVLKERAQTELSKIQKRKHEG